MIFQFRVDMFLRPNNEKIASDFIMRVCVYLKYIHPQNKSKTNYFLYQICPLFVLLNGNVSEIERGKVRVKILNTIKVTLSCLLHTNFHTILCQKFLILSKNPLNSQFKRHGPCSQKSEKKPCNNILQ